MSVTRITRAALRELIEMSESEGRGVLTNQPDNVAGKRAFNQLVRAGFAKQLGPFDFKITHAGKVAVVRACLAAGVAAEKHARLRKKRRRS